MQERQTWSAKSSSGSAVSATSQNCCSPKVKELRSSKPLPAARGEAGGRLKTRPSRKQRLEWTHDGEHIEGDLPADAVLEPKVRELCLQHLHHRLHMRNE